MPRRKVVKRTKADRHWDQFWKDMEADTPMITGVWVGYLFWKHEGEERRFLTCARSKQQAINSCFLVLAEHWDKTKAESYTKKTDALRAFIEEDPDVRDFCFTAVAVE